MQKFPRILLVDMNSFFASVEQQANPFLRGKPVGVVAATKGIFAHDTSCLIATSKEAKLLGIKTGTLVYKAKKIYPKIILLQAEPEKYREVNRRIVRIFYDYTDRVEVYSIDEAFLQLTYQNRSPLSFQKRGWGRGGLALPTSPGATRHPPLEGEGKLRLNPLLVGSEIKQRIRQEVGEWLTCSVGIGQNKFLAKLAADLQKPDGLSILWRENLPEIYKDKKLRDLWGVSYGWEARLAKIGITRPLQLLNYPVQNLISLFGKPGFYLWQRVNGMEFDSISSSPLTGEDVPPSGGTDEGGLSHPSPGAKHLPLPQGEREDVNLTSPKSFGNSWVLNFRTTDKEKLKVVILRLAEKAARRMRKEGFMAKSFYLSVRMVDGSFFARSKKLKHSINTGLELYQQVMILWRDWEFKSEVMHIAVGFRELVARSCQLSLFDVAEDFSPPFYGSLKTSATEVLDYCSVPIHRPQGKLTRLPSLAKYGGQVNQRATTKFDLTGILDAINNKYGEFTIRSGLLTRTADYAPDAIAFGK